MTTSHPAAPEMTEEWACSLGKFDDNHLQPISINGTPVTGCLGFEVATQQHNGRVRVALKCAYDSNFRSLIDDTNPRFALFALGYSGGDLAVRMFPNAFELADGEVFCGLNIAEGFDVESIKDKSQFDTEVDILADEAERDVALGSEHSLAPDVV